VGGTFSSFRHQIIAPLVLRAPARETLQSHYWCASLKMSNPRALNSVVNDASASSKQPRPPAPPSTLARLLPPNHHHSQSLRSPRRDSCCGPPFQAAQEGLHPACEDLLLRVECGGGRSEPSTTGYHIRLGCDLGEFAICFFLLLALLG
jgi:hypothetical protein